MDNRDILNNMTLSLSIPSIKPLLLDIANVTGINNFIDKINDLHIDEAVGSFKIDYEKNNIKESVYVTLKPCNATHNLTEQFDSIKPYLSEPQWTQVLKHVSFLVFLVRQVYEKIYKDFDMGIEYGKLNVDLENTTLYVPGIETRIGIFLEQI